MKYRAKMGKCQEGWKNILPRSAVAGKMCCQLVAASRFNVAALPVHSLLHIAGMRKPTGRVCAE